MEPSCWAMPHQALAWQHPAGLLCSCLRKPAGFVKVFEDKALPHVKSLDQETGKQHYLLLQDAGALGRPH